MYAINSFSPGLSNRRQPDRLDVTLPDRTQATYLREAINCDVTSSGSIRRREGYAQARAGVVHSLWGDGAQDGCAVIDGVLSVITARHGAAPAISPVAQVGYRRLSYSRGADGAIYWSDGVQSGRIVGSLTGPMFTATPSVPAVNVTGGALRAGRYLLAFTRVGTAGESAASPLVAVDVPADGGIELTGCAAGTEVFMSGPNGEVLTHVGSCWGPTFTIALPPLDGRSCETLGMLPMPAGAIVRHALGRLAIASGSVLWFSAPYRYGLRNPAENYIQFPAPITLMVPTPSGLYVAADKTYWLGSLPAESLVAVLPFGALAHSDTLLGTKSDTERYCAWMSERGPVVASAAGQAKAVNDEELAFSAAERGSTVIRDAYGERSLVITRSGVQPYVSKARDAGT